MAGALGPPVRPIAVLAIGAELDTAFYYAGFVVLLLGLVLVALFYRRLVRRLHRSEHEFHELLELAPFAIAITQRVSGKLLFANRRAISLLALSPRDYRSQRIPYVHPAEDRAQLLKRLERDGAVLDRELELLAYDGRRFPVLGSVIPIQFSGQPALMGAFQDVSNLKAIELKVRSNETRLRALFETVPDGIVILDREGRIRQASESCAALIGDSSVGRYIERPILDFISAEDRPIATEMLRLTIAGQPRETMAYRIARTDGTIVWIEPRGVAIDDPITGQPLTILVLRNITQRRLAQDELATHAAQLQDALNRIAHLQNEIVRVCAWTKEVEVDGKWIPIDHYLAKHLGLKISHGISEKGLQMLGVPPEVPPATPPPHPGGSPE